LGIAGWRYGWPARSWETTVYPLEIIDWQTAARHAPQCIGSSSGDGGGRTVFLVEGLLDESKKPVFDFERAKHYDSEFVCLRREILQDLVLPDLSGRRFRGGVFWIDMPAEHGDAMAQPLDPALAYSALLTCDTSRRHNVGYRRFARRHSLGLFQRPGTGILEDW
jgi:hypothetical protein